MEEFNKDIFECVADIVSASMEEAEISIDREGGEKVAEYFAAIYKRLCALTAAEETRAKPGEFEVYQDRKGEFRFRLKAGNGEIIAVSEGYREKASCLNGIASVQRNAVYAPVKEI